MHHGHLGVVDRHDGLAEDLVDDEDAFGEADMGEGRGGHQVAHREDARPRRCA